MSVTSTLTSLTYLPEIITINETLNTSQTTAAIQAASQFERRIRIIIPIVFSVFICVGFLGNLLVILTVITNKKLRNSTNLLVLTLAIADLSFIVLCVPFTAYKYSQTVWIFGTAWCKIHNYMAYVCASASCYTLTMMSVDRLLAVVFAVRFPYIRSTLNVAISILVMCLIVLSFNVLALTESQVYVYEGPDGLMRSTCMIGHPVLDTAAEKKVFTLFLTAGFALPAILTIIVYTVLLISVIQKTRGGNSASKAMNKAKKKVTIMCVSVVVVFILCWLPFNTIVYLVIYKSVKRSTTTVIVQIVANCLAYANSCLNPILYNIASSIFRRAVHEFIYTKICCRNSSSSLKPIGTTKSRGGSSQRSSSKSHDSKPLTDDKLADSAEQDPFIATSTTNVENGAKNGMHSTHV